MEEQGIGRPSTYAATIGTIQDRGYVFTKGPALVPTWLAFAVTRLLEEHFAAARRLRLHRLDGGGPRPDRQRRRGAGRVARALLLRRRGDLRARACADLVDDLGEIDAREINTIPIGDGIVVRVGRYGPYVEEIVPAGVDLDTGEVAEDATATPRRATITDDIAPDEMTAGEGARAARGRGRRRPGARPRPRDRSRDRRQGRAATGPTSPRSSRRTSRPNAARARPRSSRARRRSSRTWTWRPRPRHRAPAAQPAARRRRRTPSR